MSTTTNSKHQPFEHSKMGEKAEFEKNFEKKMNEATDKVVDLNDTLKKNTEDAKETGK